MTGRIEAISGAVTQIAAAAVRMQDDVAEVAAVAEQSSASTEQLTATTQQTSASAQQIAGRAPACCTAACSPATSWTPARSSASRRVGALLALGP